ncbi:hypothetical protein IAD21_03754 [Abditibacteriota bacterium]|nr:hypothetical protein IAD21_03754 [Abditibacteriota bacterium]
MNMDYFEQAIEEIEQFYIAPKQSQNTIDMVGVVKTLFRVASERGNISGRWDEDNRVHFQLGDDAARIYDFTQGAFRHILAAIAGFVRLQTPSLADSKKFNFDGDNQEIPYRVNDSVARFQIETVNNDRYLYFLILKL